MVGIYRIISPSGSINIGQSWDINERKGTYKRLECKGQKIVYASLVKHGWKSHQWNVLQEFPEDITQDILDNYEIFCINQYKEAGYKMMNIREGGSRGKHSEETKILLRNKSLTKSNHPYAKKIYEYNLKGEFFREWGSVIEASNGRNSAYSYIIISAKEANSRRKCKNSLW